MKKIIFILFVLLLSFKGYSTHLVGGTLHYEYMGRVGSEYKYKLVFTVYRDCIRAEAEYDPYIRVCVYGKKSLNLLRSYDLTIDGIKRVDPLGKVSCPALKDKVCLEKATYTREVLLPASSDGYRLKWERCCRNEQVNLPNGNDGRPKYGQSYIVDIPPTSIVNSSPYFSEVPVPFMCLNDTTEMRNYAIDPDGDSLVYSFIHPFAGADHNRPNGSDDQSCAQKYNVETVVYTSGFNAGSPFGASGYAAIDPQNGLTTFMSRITGNFAVAVQVKEYRNGFLLSTSMLDMQILVFQCEPNEKPSFSQFKESHEVVAGEEICFNFIGVDKDKNNMVTIKAIGDVFTGANGFKGPRATLAERSGLNNVSSQFCWNTSCSQARDEPYVFTLELIDNGCPPKFVNKNVYIKVVPFVSEVEIVGPSPVCLGIEYEYSTIKSKSGSSFLWTIEGGDIVSGQGSGKIKVKWNKPTGKLVIKEISKKGCFGEANTKDVTMFPAVPSPKFSGRDTVCLNNIEAYEAIKQSNVLSYKWFVSGGRIIGDLSKKEVKISWNRIGDGFLSLVQVSPDGCESDTLTMKVKVIKLKEPVILGPLSICPNNYNEYYVENSSSQSIYRWFYNGVLQTQSDSARIVIRFGNPAMDLVSVVEENQIGCVSDTGKIVIKVDHKLDGEIPKLRDEFCEFTKNERFYVSKGINSTYEWGLGLGSLVSGQGDNEIFVDWDTVGNGFVSIIERAYDSINNIPCLSERHVLPVIIHPKPETKGVFGDMDLCQVPGLTTDFSVIGFANSNFKWSFNGNGNRVINQGNENVKYPVDIADTFLIKVYETSEFGCVGDTLDSLLYIRPRPVANLILGDEVVCFPDITNKGYVLQGFEGSTYEWWIQGGEFVTVDSNRVLVNWFNNKTGQLSVLETSSFGCVGDTIKLNVWIDNPSIKLDVITVLPPPLNDNGIELKWHLVNGERYDKTFQIQRRKAGSSIGFENIGQVSGSTFLFIDEPLNTDSNAFEYRIQGQDLCGNELISDIHTNILLKGTQPDAYSASLSFSDYIGWKDGVSIYQFNRKLVDKTPYEWYYDALESHTAFFENGLEHFTQCYRVKGTELGGKNQVTWSNEVCFDYEPVVYAPNAFTVNGDSKNDIYFVVAGSVKTVKLSIYNRWGEKLFETQDVANGWDGTYNGKLVGQGVYVYSLEYTSHDDTPYRQKGTITLLK